MSKTGFNVGPQFCSVLHACFNFFLSGSHNAMVLKVGSVMYSTSRRSLDCFYKSHDSSGDYYQLMAKL